MDKRDPAPKGAGFLRFIAEKVPSIRRTTPEEAPLSLFSPGDFCSIAFKMDGIDKKQAETGAIRQSLLVFVWKPLLIFGANGLL
ncbi:MAG: hypothetical protein RRY97_02345 [Oscillibacter sp.]